MPGKIAQTRRETDARYVSSEKGQQSHAQSATTHAFPGPPSPSPNRRTTGALTASSRGLDTSKPRDTGLSPLVVAELKRLKISADLVAGYPRQLKREDSDAADVVVLLDGREHAPMLQKQFPQVNMAKVRQWSVQDVPAMAAGDAFAEIARRVDLLVADLAARLRASLHGK